MSISFVLELGTDVFAKYPFLEGAGKILKDKIQEDYKDAEETLSVALNLYPHHPELQLMKIKVTAQLGDYTAISGTGSSP